MLLGQTLDGMRVWDVCQAIRSLHSVDGLDAVPEARAGQVLINELHLRLLTSSGLEFRTVGRLGIEGVFFSTFFGGSDPSWATPRTQYAEFAAFAVSDGPIGPLPGAP